jgi:signal transduction histidine kinase
MESLSLRLLDLARAEDAALVLHRESVALADAIAAAWQPWTARANARGITLDLELPPALTALTDAALLGVILENLCANAAEHAPAGTPFRIRAGDSSEAVTLVFQNRNDGITAADLSQIFEKFWRKDPSRSDGRHHGLGLSLAAELAALLGGTLTARLDADGDLEFTLRLPASAPA